MILVACSFSPKPATEDARPIDAPIDTLVVVPDGGPCAGASMECLADGDTLRICADMGAAPMDTTCPWGCVSTGVSHCGALVPTGSAAMPGDLDGADLGSAVTIPDNTTINQSTGAIGNGIRPQGAGVKNGIDFENRNGIAVFRFNGLTIAGRLQFTIPGPAVVLVSAADLTVDGAIDLQGNCVGGKGGPGGFAAGAGHTSAAGSGGGSGGAANDKAQGGGGGGFGAAGGSGGDDDGTMARAGGAGFGDPQITVLSGGGGGGGGGNGGNAFGGGGGGAIQLVANGQLSIGNAGSINAGGCGGVTGDTLAGGAGGGGAGAGGAVLLEAHDVAIAGQLAVNGGGGGASNGPGGDHGADAGLGRAAAAGSTLNTGGAVGGDGGAALSLAGATGGNSNGFAGGGGGGVGRMRFNTRAGSATVDNTKLSPALDDSPTTCTQGVAATQ